MYSLPSTSVSREPSPLSTNSGYGVQPDHVARAVLLTPPGIDRQAISNSSALREVSSPGASCAPPTEGAASVVVLIDAFIRFAFRKYDLSGLESVASEDRLRDAGAEEPECTRRYMRIPSTAGAQAGERSSFPSRSCRREHAPRCKQLAREQRGQQADRVGEAHDRGVGNGRMAAMLDQAVLGEHVIGFARRAVIRRPIADQQHAVVPVVLAH